MYTENPKVTVIIPAYNSEKFIVESVKSILHQTYNNIELIVVDDCSTDDTGKIVANINDSRITLIRQNTNSGYAACINKALEISTGDYIARMDASDISHPSRIEKQMAVFEMYPDAAFVSCNRYRITPGGVKFKSKAEKTEGLSFVYWDDIITNSRTFVDPGTIIEKNKLLKAGGYRTYQRSGMDVDLWLRLLEIYEKGVICNELFYGYRLDVNGLIFNPLTSFSNKFPRILAQQRKYLGREDMLIAKLEQNKSVAENEDKKNYGLAIGIASTCLYLFDFKGLLIALKNQRNKSGKFFIVETIKKSLNKRLYIQKMSDS